MQEYRIKHPECRLKNKFKGPNPLYSQEIITEHYLKMIMLYLLKDTLSDR